MSISLTRCFKRIYYNIIDLEQYLATTIYATPA
jgi:hypothetical protein